MKKLLAFDHWLLTQVYQRIVNETGRDPLQLMEASATTFFVLAQVQIWTREFTWMSPVSALLAAVLLGVFLLMRRLPLARAIFRVSHLPAIRVTLFILPLLDIITLLAALSIDLPLARCVLSLAASIATLSSYYFVDCDDPPPPRTRDDLVPEGV